MLWRRAYIFTMAANRNSVCCQLEVHSERNWYRD